MARFKGVQPATQADRHLDQPQHQRAQGREVFITTDTAAQLLGQPTRAAFRMWAKRRGLTVVKFGGAWRVSELDIRAELKRRERTA